MENQPYRMMPPEPRFIKNAVYVYRAENKLNGKSYIGITNNVQRRIKEHKKLADAGSESHFYRAIRKYGWGNFAWTILAECNNLHCASISEQVDIRHFDSYRNGYNMTTGGESRWTKVTKPETKKKLAALYQGKTFEELHGAERAAEIKARMSQKHQGKILSDKTKALMSEANRKRWREGGLIGKKGHPCEVEGQQYKNLVTAARSLGVTKEAVKYWIRKNMHGARLL